MYVKGTEQIKTENLLKMGVTCYKMNEFLQLADMNKN